MEKSVVKDDVAKVQKACNEWMSTTVENLTLDLEVISE